MNFFVDEAEVLEMDLNLDADIKDAPENKILLNKTQWKEICEKPWDAHYHHAGHDYIAFYDNQPLDTPIAYYKLVN